MGGFARALKELPISQTEFGREVGLRKTSISLMAADKYRPKNKKTLQKIKDVLERYNISFQEEEKEQEVKNIMLTKEAKVKFRIFKDPFDEVSKSKEVYFSPGMRFVSEYMYTTAKQGGILAVIGESGSGKTTLRRHMLDRIRQEELKIKVIFPRSLDKSRLTAGAITDAIIADISDEKPRRTLEAKARQIERLLQNSSRAGWSHTIIIEEAHDLSPQTLKYLKRFWELEDGFKKLLSIILIAQPEIKPKLDESRNWEAREVIRRIEIAELPPLNTAEEIEKYLGMKLKTAGIESSKVFSAGAAKALVNKLTRQTSRGEKVLRSYPLTLNNLVKNAINLAAEVGSDRVTKEIIHEL